MKKIMVLIGAVILCLAVALGMRPTEPTPERSFEAVVPLKVSPGMGRQAELDEIRHPLQAALREHFPDHAGQVLPDYDAGSLTVQHRRDAPEELREKILALASGGAPISFQETRYSSAELMGAAQQLISRIGGRPGVVAVAPSEHLDGLKVLVHEETAERRPALLDEALYAGLTDVPVVVVTTQLETPMMIPG